MRLIPLKWLTRGQINITAQGNSLENSLPKWNATETIQDFSFTFQTFASNEDFFKLEKNGSEILLGNLQASKLCLQAGKDQKMVCIGSSLDDNLRHQVHVQLRSNSSAIIFLDGVKVQQNVLEVEPISDCFHNHCFIKQLSCVLSPYFLINGHSHKGQACNNKDRATAPEASGLMTFTRVRKSFSILQRKVVFSFISTLICSCSLIRT